MEISIQVVFYGHLKQRVGEKQMEFRVPEGITVGEFREIVKKRLPAIAPQLVNLVVLVNKKNLYLDDQVLPDQAELSFIPPISGG